MPRAQISTRPSTSPAGTGSETAAGATTVSVSGRPEPRDGEQRPRRDELERRACRTAAATVAYVRVRLDRRHDAELREPPDQERLEVGVALARASGCRGASRRPSRPRPRAAATWHQPACVRVAGLDADRAAGRRRAGRPRCAASRPPAIVAGLLADGVADEAGPHQRRARASSRRAALEYVRPARRARPGGRSACRAGRAPPPSRSSARANDGKSGATESASASAASFADWISAPLIRSRTVSCSPARRSIVDSPTAAARGSTVTTSRELVVLERDEHRHQLRDRRDRQSRRAACDDASTSPVRASSTRYALRVDRRRRRLRAGAAQRRARAAASSERAASPDPDLLADEERGRASPSGSAARSSRPGRRSSPR